MCTADHSDEIERMRHKPNRLNWLPGGAQGNNRSGCQIGDFVLTAVQYTKRHKPTEWYWSYEVCEWREVDYECGELHSEDGRSWGDVEWYIPVSDIPVPQEKTP